MLRQSKPLSEQFSNDIEEEKEESTFAERLKNEVPREMQPFALWPEESRIMYKYPLQLKTSANSPVKENILYVGHENGFLKYWIRTPTGVHSFIMDTEPKTLRIHPNFTLGQIAPFQKKIYDIVKENNHFPPDESTYEGGIPCEEYPKWSLTRYLMSWLSPSNWWNWFSDRKRFSVPDGKIGLIYDNGKPKFVNSGEYILLSPWSHFHKLEDAETLKAHGTTRIIKVGSNQLFYVGNKATGDFKLLRSGTHVLENTTSLDIRPVTDPYGKMASIEKTEEELDIERKALASERAKVRSEDRKDEKTSRPKEPSPLRPLFVNVADGNIGIVYNDEGQMTIWRPARYYIPPRWYFHTLFSTKEGDVKCEVVCPTTINGQAIDMKITGKLTYQLSEDKALTVIQAKGISHVMDNIKDAGAEEAKKQISPNFVQQLPPDYDAAMNTAQAEAIIASLNKNQNIQRLGVNVIGFVITGMEAANPEIRKALLERQLQAIRQTPSRPMIPDGRVSDVSSSFYHHSQQQQQPAYNPMAAPVPSAPSGYSSQTGQQYR